MEAQVVSQLGAKNLASMLDDPRQYNVSDIGKHNPLSCLPCATSNF